MTGELILVVDDGKDNRDFLVQYVLEPNGFRHDLARDGEEGLRKALQKRPDLILLDLQMPKLNGIQVLEQLHARALEIPVILMTFHGSEEIAIEVYRMGVKDYIKKPYYPEEMLEAINRSLAETRLRQERDALTDRVIQANQQLNRYIEQLKVLADVGKLVTSITDVEQLLPQIVDAAVHLSAAEEGILFLVEGRSIVQRARKYPRRSQSEAIHKPVKDRIVAHVLKQREAVNLNAKQIANAMKSDEGPYAMMCLPLIANRRALGALQLIQHTASSGKFTQSDEQLLGTLADYAAIAIHNSASYRALEDEQSRMRDTFERFVAPSVVAKALDEDAGEVKLGGARQEITVLFADIRGYTKFSENVEPERVVELLNAYLSVAATTIIGWEGTLDKFFGDGLMAIFNAPVPQPDHVHRASEASIALMSAVKEINADTGFNLSYSVGINVGEAVVGYIGTRYAVNYTAIGDTVNLAKRLQEYAAPGQILVDESVVKRLGKQVQARPLGDLRVKGRSTPAHAYELLEIYT